MDPQIRNLLNIFPALYFALDQQYTIVHVSKGAHILLGYDPSELVGKSITELIAEEDLEKTCQAIKQLTAGQNRPGFINRLKHRSKNLIAISWYGIIDPKTNWIYCLGQKATPPEFFLHPAHAIGLQTANAEGQLSLDSSWRIYHINEEAAQLLGSTVDELLQQNLWEHIPESKRSLFEAQYSKVLKEKVPVRFETYCPNLHQQWFEVSAFPHNDGASVFIRNIDADKRAQEELWKLSLIARETNNIVVLTDAFGNISWVNNAFTRITGFTSDEMIGQKLSTMLIGTETDTATTLSIQEAIEKRSPFQFEVLQYNKQGRKMWMEIHGQPVKDSTGTVQQFFSIQTDITQRKQFEEELKQEQQQRQRNITRATIEAQERERSLVSQELHDNVNQVLTTVKLYTELCLSGIDRQDELLRKSLHLLQESINEIRSLSKRLSAPTLGKFRLRDSVKELIESIEATNRLDIEADISLLEDLEVPQELHLGIYRILQEHFTNILKHSLASNVQVSFKVVNEELVLKVRDDGKGFDTKEFRSGIGIANMFSRAESLKGILTLNSAPGLGCVLLVRFPLSS